MACAAMSDKGDHATRPEKALLRKQISMRTALPSLQ